eukprot:jgi/Ulvmu1/8715/UM047_0055.1
MSGSTYGKRARGDDDEDNYLLKLADELEEEDYVPVKERRARLASKRRPREDDQPARDSPRSETIPAKPLPDAPPQRPQASLLKASAAARQNQPVETAAEKQAKEEKAFMESLMKKQALRSAEENARSIEYKEPLSTGWTAPSWALRRSEADNQRVRDKMHIVCDGAAIPPPLTSFAAMRLPAATLATLAADGIATPTPIQAQALPVLLSGRDCVGISSTGSGKTLAFVLPMLMHALQEEWRMPLQQAEGPIGLVVCPSRELARQTFNIVTVHAAALAAAGWPELRSLLCVGGEDMRGASDALRRGVHSAVCTPGRLKDFLAKRRMTLDLCRYLCLDEADRMVDTGFEEDLREIISFFRGQRQTAMFSATMPEKIRAFASSALVAPITVNVARAGAANKNVLQEVEYVKAEDKLARLEECLQKTAPPVMVFAEKTRDVDMVHEALLLRNVNAAAIHGGKDQQERTQTIERFKDGRADVLCATDIAAKGLDFDGIKHVINFDMPAEIENYVHRIGRTGRRGRSGLATTFVSQKEDSDVILLDLKHLLMEADQPIPPVLQAIEDPMEAMLASMDAAHGGDDGRGCKYCGGLGHRLQNCPKLRAETRQAEAKHRGSMHDGGRALGGDM